MFIYIFILLLNILIGLVIPFKQYNKGLFLYFLVSGIADPIIIPFHMLFGSDNNIFSFIYHSIGYLITIHYLKKKDSGSYHLTIIVLLLCMTGLFIFNILFDAKTNIGTQIIIGASVFPLILTVYSIFLLMTANILSTAKLNFYYPVLILLNLLALLRIITLALRLQVGIEYYVITYFIEAIIGIYFVFFDIKNSPQIPLAGKKANTEALEP